MQNTYQVAGTAIIHELLDNEVIIANLDSGVYYSLRESGIPLWQLLSSNHDLANINKMFSEKYQQPLQEAEMDSFIKRLLEEGLLTTGAVTEAQIPAELFWPEQFNNPTIEKYEEMKDLLMLDPIHEVDEQGWPNKSIGT